MAQNRIAVSDMWNLGGWGGASRASLKQRRVAARVIDLVITGVLALVFASLAGMILARHEPELWGLWAFILYPVLWTSLMFVSDTVGVGLFGYTLGKRLQGIRVVCVGNGGSPGWKRALVRARTQPLAFAVVVWVPFLLVRILWPIVFVSTWLAWVVSHLCLLGFARRPDGRGGPDRRAETVVVVG